MDGKVSTLKTICVVHSYSCYTLADPKDTRNRKGIERL